MARARVDPSSRMVLEPAPLRSIAAPGAPTEDARPFTFVELFARSTFSGISIDGVAHGIGRAASCWPGSGTPEEIVDRAAVLGVDAVAVVDVDTLAGVVRAHKQAKERGLRAIVGCELRLPRGQGGGSLVLHAASLAGWSALCRILTDAREGREKGDIRYDFDAVVDVVERLGRRAGDLGLWATVLPPFEKGKLARLREVFGAQLSLGVWRHQTPEDAPRTAWTWRASQEFDIPLVATARPFLVERSDKRLHDVLTCIRQGLTLRGAGQRLLPNAEAHLRASTEMVSLFLDMPQAVARSRQIADACTFSLADLRYRFPRTDDGSGDVESDGAKLRRLTFAGAAQRYAHGLSDKHRAQIEHELKIIDDLDVAAYFLTVKDIVDVANDLRILCQGRGSAANSVVCYCLGITSVDPVAMELLFERFLSKERGEPPDIDVDFEHERREEVIQEIYRRWGRRHAAMVSEVIAFRGKSAIREVGKVFGLTDVITGRLTALMHHSSLRELPADVLGVDVKAGDDAYAAVEQTLVFAARLQGHPRHLGIHVGGFVLTREPITDVAPVEPARMANRTVLPWDKDDIEELCFFKMDVLGLGIMTCIRKCFGLIALHGGPALALHTIPADDVVTYDAISRADTVGVFQIESRAQMSMLPRLQPRCFYDLVVQVAIVRPGPIQGGMVHPYLKARDDLKKGIQPTMPHERLRPVLGRTLGVPLFQEQVMRMAIEGAGYSPGEADQLRRDMAAWKKTGRLERHRTRLVQGFQSLGISAEMSERMYAQVQGFGEYGFPESHAASFARLAYVSAYLKTHHPAAFVCALINSLPMGFYAPSQLVADVKAHGVVVAGVDVNDSDWDCTLFRGADGALALRLGLRLVKGLSEETGRRLVDERVRGGAFVDVADATRRVGLNKKERLALARAGAFDRVSAHRRAAVWNGVVDRAPLFAGLRDDDVGATLPPAAPAALLLMDYRHTGVSLDDHPMNHLRARVQKALARHARARLLPCREANTTTTIRRGTVAGLVIGRQRPGTADGTCFITLEDETGMSNVVVWGRDFDRWHRVIVPAAFLLVRGKIERKDNVVHVIAEDVAAIHADLEDADGVVDLEFAGKRDKPAPPAQGAFPFAARSFH
jgi:error-prone DNA polymerase